MPLETPFRACIVSAAARATTPPKSGAVFVLLENGDPVGTAFAVQCGLMDKLITAGHNIHNRKATFSIAPRVEKDALGHKIAYGTWRNPKRVEVVDMGSTEEDWAVLRLPAATENTESIPLCPVNELNRIDPTDNFWVYYCPVETFTGVGGIPGVGVNVSAKMHPMFISIARKEIYLPVGLWKGCSGGVVVDSKGRAVAIHISSTNTMETLEEVTKKSGGDDRNSDVESVLNSITSTHASYTTSRLISCCIDLLEALER